MPKGPRGEWRPTSTVAAAVHVAKLSTSESQETCDAPSRPGPRGGPPTRPQGRQGPRRIHDTTTALRSRESRRRQMVRQAGETHRYLSQSTPHQPLELSGHAPSFSLSRNQAEMRIWRKIFTTELSLGHLCNFAKLSHRVV